MLRDDRERVDLTADRSSFSVTTMNHESHSRDIVCTLLTSLAKANSDEIVSATLAPGYLSGALRNVTRPEGCVNREPSMTPSVNRRREPIQSGRIKIIRQKRVPESELSCR